MTDLSTFLPEWKGLSVDEIAIKIAQIPKDLRDDLVGAANNFTAGMKWLPQPGPQTDAFFSPADILFFGGQAGGGKTDLSLGLAMTAHKRSLVLREQYVELSFLTDRAIKINGTRAGFNGSSPPSLRTEDGRYIQFAGANIDNVEDWMGIPFDLKCVGFGTPVRMADGSTKAIQEIVEGDMVQTIEGARRVTRIFPPKLDEAVRVDAIDAQGRNVGSQVQGASHSLLTLAGWASHDTSAELLRRANGEPTVSRGASESSRLSAQSTQRSPKSQAACAGEIAQVRALWLRLQSYLRMLGSFGDMARSVRTIGCALSERSRQAWQRLVLQTEFLKGRLELADPSGALRPFSKQEFYRDDYDAGSLSSLRYSRGDCWSGNRHGDGHALPTSDLSLVVEGGLICPRPQAGVEQPSPNGFADDGRGQIPTRSLRKRTYDHPYTMEKRQADLATDVFAFRFTPVGIRVLFDIEVEEINSYITEPGFVNKNCFDEAVKINEKVIRFHIGWLRSSEPGQRTRVVMASNPPVSSQGDWIIPMFAPWLDITHPNPAKPGELRWYVTDPDGKDFEVPGPEPYQFPDGKKPVCPMSRTFIPSKLSDNIYYANSDYEAKLDAMPEPYRSAFRDGNFMASRSDQDNQVIPTAWVLAANKRWTKGPPEDVAMSAIAADVGAGGVDRVVLAPRYAEYYGELICVAGKDAKNGSEQAALIVRHRRDGCGVVVDVGGGYGGDCCGRLEDNNIKPTRFDGSAGSSARAHDGSGRIFLNRRAEAWWRFREALNPDQTGGSQVALPPDPELTSELCAVRFIPDIAKIQIEDKKEVKKRLGRSPDKADAVVMAWAPGDRAMRRARFGGNTVYERPSSANVGYADVKRSFGRQ